MASRYKHFGNSSFSSHQLKSLEENNKNLKQDLLKNNSLHPRVDCARYSENTNHGIGRFVINKRHANWLKYRLRID